MSNNIYKIVSLYSFFSFQENSIIDLKENLFNIEKNNDISGLLIIAREGLNGTTCAEKSIIENILHLIKNIVGINELNIKVCLLYTSPSPRDRTRSRMPSSA